MIPLKDTVRARSFPWVNTALILANAAVFGVELSRGSGAVATIERLGVVPARFLDHTDLGQVATLFAALFIHAGWVHIIGNMLALYIFGDNVEDRLGHAGYALFYLLCGVAANFSHIAANTGSTLPTIGASGAISGVMAAYLLLFPRSHVITLVPIFFFPWIIEIPALVYIGFWFLSQLWNGVATVVANLPAEASGGVAFWAHVGGFVTGAVLVPVFIRLRPYGDFHLDEHWPW